MSYDVKIIGGGIAALTAALAAREKGAKVCLYEAAPFFQRGGNTRHSRNLRIMHSKDNPYIPAEYQEDEFFKELEKASNAQFRPDLTRIFIKKSESIPEWLALHGLVFQTKNIPHSRKTAFFLGGGRAAVNSLYERVEQLGVHIHYNYPVTKVSLERRKQTTILCCGGSQACLDSGMVNRGTPFAKGEILDNLVEQGALDIGTKTGGHIVAVDARSPLHDGGIVTRIDGMEYGIVVDHRGNRFQDETAFRKQTRYSLWGRLINRLPEKYAVLILDRKGIMKAPVFAYQPFKAETLPELSQKLNLPLNNILNSVIQTDRIKEPPFYALPISPGIAFTHRGIQVDGKARVLMKDGSALENIFAAGMIMSPNILGTGYLAGIGVTIGTVFGRIAGEEAAFYALK